MTDTERKEVEKIVYNSNNVIRDIVKWIEEDRKRHQDNNLVPLEQDKVLDEINLILSQLLIQDNPDKNGWTKAMVITDRIFSKFGKDNSGMDEKSKIRSYK